MFKGCSTEESQGFKCGPHCLSVENWCSDSDRNDMLETEEDVDEIVKANCPRLGKTFDNDQLCRNETFWRNISCAHGRCSGNWPGQCKKKSGPNPCTDLKGTCKDKSDVVCPSDGEFKEACESPLMYKCVDSTMCIHKYLVCDGHAQCKDGSDEDEKNCSVCPQPGKNPAATFTCIHRYTQHKTCAVPLDGIDDFCQKNEDENPNLLSNNYLVLIAGFLIVFIVMMGELLVYSLVNKKKSNSGFVDEEHPANNISLPHLTSRSKNIETEIKLILIMMKQVFI